MEPTLNIEQFAELSAEIDAGTAREEVIARAGLTLEAWTAAQESWLAKLADEAARKRFELTNRYNAAFVARRRALEGGSKRGKRAAARKAKKEGEAAPARPPSIAPPPAVPEVGGLGAAPPPLMSAMPPIAPPPPVMAAAIAAPAIAAPAIAAPPMVAPPPVVAPPPPVIAPPPMAAPSAFDVDGGTLEAQPSPLGRALPFGQQPPGDPGATVVGAISPFARPEALPFRGGAGGAAQEPKRPAPPAAGLPFRAAGDNTSPPDAAKPATQPIVPPSPDQGATVVGAISPFARPEALPFRGGPAPNAEPARSAQPAAGLPFRPSGGAPPAQQQPPQQPSPPAAAKPASPPAPQQPAAAKPASPPAQQQPAAAKPASPPAQQQLGAQQQPARTRFTLEQYASLTAELSLNTSGAAQVRARYGLDDASYRAEAEEWNRRFSADKDLYARYGQLCGHYREWLTRKPR